MNYIRITGENIDREHICCAMSGKQSLAKKEWMKRRFDEGLVFYRSEERGKCFIEYIPAENAWVPITADGYIYINCLWVAGSMKGHGYSNDLLSECVRDAGAQKKKGVCILCAGGRKREFLADPKFLTHKGFRIADRSDCGINLMYLPLIPDAAPPEFRECARHPGVSENGFVLYCTDQCPFVDRDGNILVLHNGVCSGGFFKQHFVVFLTVHIKLIAFQRQKNGFLKVQSVQPAVVDCNFGSSSAVKGIEQLRVFKEHTVLDIRRIFTQKKHSAVAISDFEIVAFKLHRIRADIILEIVSFLPCFLNVKMKRAFLTDSVKVVENSQSFIRFKLGAFASESAEVGDQVCADTGKVVSCFLYVFLTYYWVPRVSEAAKEHGIPLKVIHVTDKETAQNVPAPVTTYALFRDGKFLTQSIQSDKKFLALAGITN